MYVNGTGSKLIVEYLNKNHYLSPSGYRNTGIIQNENKSNYFWNATTICDMLKNEVYIGNTVQNKVSVVSYKVKKLRKVEKERHIRVENTHEAIIDKDIFEKTQRIHKERAKKVIKQYDYLLRSLIYCKHYNDKLNEILTDIDFTRISAKFVNERDKLTNEKSELMDRFRNLQGRQTIKNKNDEEQMNKIITEFLEMKEIDKSYLFRLIDKIDIDKNKNVFISFNFAPLNTINENIDEFIEVGKILNGEKAI